MYRLIAHIFRDVENYAKQEEHHGEDAIGVEKQLLGTPRLIAPLQWNTQILYLLIVWLACEANTSHSVLPRDI